VPDWISVRYPVTIMDSAIHGITLAREVLGWDPRVQLEMRLANTIAYFDELLRNL